MRPTKSNSKNAVTLDSIDHLIVRSLARLDGIALGISLGTVFGAVICLATVVLIFKGGDVIGPNLSLLSQYFIGYEVSYSGSLIGLFYGFVFGFGLGWLIAFLRNIIISAYLHILRIKRSLSSVSDYIDHP
jgi:hypothetical protein